MSEAQLWDEIRALKRMVDTLKTETRTPIPLRRGYGTIARYTTAAGQSISNTTVTIVDFGTKVADTHGLVTTGAAWKFTAARDAYYLASACVMFSGTTEWGSHESSYIELWKNGSKYSVLEWRHAYSITVGQAQYIMLSGNDVIYLQVGDYIDIRVYQGSGGSLALASDAANNRVSIFAIA